MDALHIVLVSLGVCIAIAALAFWVAMLRSCLRARPLQRRERIAWLSAIVFGKLAGAIAYYLCRHRHHAAISPPRACPRPS